MQGVGCKGWLKLAEAQVREEGGGGWRAHRVGHVGGGGAQGAACQGRLKLTEAQVREGGRRGAVGTLGGTRGVGGTGGWMQGVAEAHKGTRKGLRGEGGACEAAVQHRLGQWVLG